MQVGALALFGVLLYLSAKLVIRYVLWLPLVLWCRTLSRVANDNGAEGDDGLGQMEHLRDGCYTVVHGIESRPDGTETESVGSQ